MTPIDKKLIEFLSTPSARRATQVSHNCFWHGRFLSTPSVRRATSPARGSAGKPDISIHALREEGDTGLIHP